MNIKVFCLASVGAGMMVLPGVVEAGNQPRLSVKERVALIEQARQAEQERKRREQEIAQMESAKKYSKDLEAEQEKQIRDWRKSKYPIDWRTPFPEEHERNQEDVREWKHSRSMYSTHPGIPPAE